MQPISLLPLASVTVWIEVAMIIFMAVFLAIVIWVLLARPGHFNRAARMPLDDRHVSTPRRTRLPPPAAPSRNTPMSSADHDRLFDHDYDGIREYDNPLPGWWKWLFWLSIFFAVAYVAFYHIGPGPSVHESYEAQVAAYFEEQLSRLGITSADDATIVRLMNDTEMMTALAGMFQGNCAQCHRSDAGGNIGPNLTDDHWKNVKRPSDIFDVITNGVAGTGMSSWERRLREPQRILLAAYVASLRGTSPADAKAPEGSPIGPWPTAAELEAEQAEQAPPAAEQ